MQKVIPRPRLLYAGLAAITIALGLATRPLRTVISPASAENLGDALWAGLVFWLVAWLLPRQSSLRIALAAFAISATVECSQLYHVPWLDAVRRTVLGGLILGWGFSWTDFLAYAAGIAACFLLEWRFRAVPRTDVRTDQNETKTDMDRL